MPTRERRRRAAQTARAPAFGLALRAAQTARASYRADRGGHAPEYLREALVEVLSDQQPEELRPGLPFGATGAAVTAAEQHDCRRAGLSAWWYAPLARMGFPAPTPASDAILWAATHRWAAMTARQRAEWLVGQLWNCSDVAPRDVCETVGLPRKSTYGQAARELRRALNEKKGQPLRAAPVHSQSVSTPPA